MTALSFASGCSALADLVCCQIEIGGFENTRSGILLGVRGQWMVQVDSPGIVDCDEFRPFWISWQDNVSTSTVESHYVGTNFVLIVGTCSNNCPEVQGFVF